MSDIMYSLKINELNKKKSKGCECLSGIGWCHIDVILRVLGTRKMVSHGLEALRTGINTAEDIKELEMLIPEQPF